MQSVQALQAFAPPPTHQNSTSMPSPSPYPPTTSLPPHCAGVQPRWSSPNSRVITDYRSKYQPTLSTVEVNHRIHIQQWTLIMFYSHSMNGYPQDAPEMNFRAFKVVVVFVACILKVFLEQMKSIPHLGF
ncbi:MAG: hypothetical protein AAGJ35_01910 [Myxococcota bacterium]